MSGLASFFGGLLRSRAVHFLVVGGVLAALAPKEPDARKVVVDGPRILDALRAEQARRGRSLTRAEKADTVRELVDEEVLAREALRTGIGTEDGVVRARLAERMRRSFAGALAAPSVSEDELSAEIARHGSRAVERVRLAVWFVARERSDAARAAEALAREVAELGPERARGRGDRSPLPDGATWTEEALARAAGGDVAHAAMLTPVGKPSAALASAWGFYVVVPLERLAPDPDEVRAEALARLRAAKHEAQIRQRIARVRGEYVIEVRAPNGEAPFDVDAPPSTRPEGVD